MFLKSLTLRGFKSFADATTLEMEPGVTVVVGPNGSGKSNVVDAIGWVLGAQAPSTVRSQKMDDVIFAGAGRRAALGRAEVALTIDNTMGLLPIEFSEVTLTRTLFRTGESEYAINGVPCRLLDLQELLSDTGVGRQQHVIISQGQIDGVLNARPEDRRLIIEEAAGVLKFRRRKEKAERRLAATETNLTRLGDLLREVRRQLRPLERQADAARRHGAVVAELVALRIHVAGRDLARLTDRLESGRRDRSTLAAEERDRRDVLGGLDTDVLATESHLSAIGGHDLGDSLAELESLSERARGLRAVLAERRRGIERALAATVDAAVIASLEADATRLAGEVADADAEAADLAEQRVTAEQDWAEAGVDAGPDAAPVGRAAELRGELVALRAGVVQGLDETGRTRSRLNALEAKDAGRSAEAERLRAERHELDDTEGPLAARLDAAEVALAEADAALAAATTARRAADADHHRSAARAEALTSALDGARARAGAERLSGLDGVLGTLLDVVDVDPGWEAAFEAAAGEAVAAVVVDDTGVGRRALDLLHRIEGGGAVVPAGGWGPGAASPPPVGEPVRAHVRSSRPVVVALLDGLLGSAVAVAGWTEAVDAVLAHPGAVVVTRDGDRFGPAGWRVGAAGAGVTGAALQEAERQAGRAAEVTGNAERAERSAGTAAGDTRRLAAELAQTIDGHRNRRRVVGDTLARIDADGREIATETDALRAQLLELGARTTRDQGRLAELEEMLPRIEALEARADQARSQRRDLEVRAAGVEQRRAFLEQRRAEVEERLSRNVAERQQAEARRVELGHTLLVLDRLAAFVAERSTVLDAALADLRERRRRQTSAAREVAARLEDLRRRRAEGERHLAELRERLQRAELAETEGRLRLETAVESLRRDLDCEPERAMAASCPELAEGTTPPARIRELERELRLMGPINPLALEEYEALCERHEFLQGQLDDVKSTRRDLSKIIRAVDGEIERVFAAAYADVADNFTALFETLFPGGKGRLRLTDPDNLLDTGIELEARPSGKNVKKLSLLSGGERSLTALAYLFAVFRARPSPFYVMDEVEAALDDVNLHRFLGLLDEFRTDAQLIVVTHQKRTMEAADCLYGVTMEPGGSSKVVSERVTALSA